jgi:hypothetical protein
MMLSAPHPAATPIRKDPLLILLTPIFALAGVVVGIFLFFRGFRLLSRKRLIAATPRSTVRSAAMGQVEISGKIVGPYTLISPLSQLDCFYYRAEAWIYEGEGRNKRRKKVAQETLCVPFFVEDETGRLMVDPRDAEIEFPPSYDDDGVEYSEPALRFLGRRGISPGSFVILREHCIQPGDQLFVLGTLGENQPRSIASLQGNPSQEGDIHFLSQPAADLQRRESLEAMQVPLPRYAATATSSAEDFDTNPPALLRKEAGQLFMLARSSPRSVVEELAWQSSTYIWGGAVLALVSAGVLLASLNLW